VSGESSVDGEWMAYLGGCRHLRALCATNCKALTNNAIWQLTGTHSLVENRFCSFVMNSEQSSQVLAVDIMSFRSWLSLFATIAGLSFLFRASALGYS